MFDWGSVGALLEFRPAPVEGSLLPVGIPLGVHCGVAAPLGIRWGCIAISPAFRCERNAAILTEPDGSRVRPQRHRNGVAPESQRGRNGIATWPKRNSNETATISSSSPNEIPTGSNLPPTGAERNSKRAPMELQSNPNEIRMSSDESLKPQWNRNGAVTKPNGVPIRS